MEFSRFLRRGKPDAQSFVEMNPDGPNNSLTGLTFVMTGKFGAMSHCELNSLVQRNGGQVLRSPKTPNSNQTNFLIVGDDGSGMKIQGAQQKRMRLKDLLYLIKLIGPVNNIS